MKKASARLLIVMLTLAVSWAPFQAQAETIRERPTASEMSVDLLMRPVYVAGAVIGTGMFIIGSPFSLLGGNMGESFTVLVAEPFAASFVRCLGCTRIGRAEKVIEE